MSRWEHLIDDERGPIIEQRLTLDPDRQLRLDAKLLQQRDHRDRVCHTMGAPSPAG